MLPRKIPNWFLIVLWLGSLVPYLIIKLWLMKLPPLFDGAGVIADVCTNSLLAFFTAFPFWWVVAWFERRQSKSQAAGQIDYFLNDMHFWLHQVVSNANYMSHANVDVDKYKDPGSLLTFGQMDRFEQDLDVIYKGLLNEGDQLWRLSMQMFDKSMRDFNLQVVTSLGSLLASQSRYTDPANRRINAIRILAERHLHNPIVGWENDHGKLWRMNVAWLKEVVADFADLRVILNETLGHPPISTP